MTDNDLKKVARIAHGPPGYTSAELAWAVEVLARAYLGQNAAALKNFQEIK